MSNQVWLNDNIPFSEMPQIANPNGLPGDTTSAPPAEDIINGMVYMSGANTNYTCKLPNASDVFPLLDNAIPGASFIMYVSNQGTGTTNWVINPSADGSFVVGWTGGITIGPAASNVQPHRAVICIVQNSNPLAAGAIRCY